MPVDVRAYCAMSVDVAFPLTKYLETKNRAWVEQFKEQLRNEIQKIAAADKKPTMAKLYRSPDGKDTVLATSDRKADIMTRTGE